MVNEKRLPGAPSLSFFCALTLCPAALFNSLLFVSVFTHLLFIPRPFLKRIRSSFFSYSIFLPTILLLSFLPPVLITPLATPLAAEQCQGLWRKPVPVHFTKIAFNKAQLSVGPWEKITHPVAQRWQGSGPIWLFLQKLGFLMKLL